MGCDVSSLAGFRSGMFHERRALFCAAVVIAAAFIGCQGLPQTRELRYMKRGQAYLKKKDLARATLEFRNAAQLMPNDPESHYQLGLVYLQTNIVNGAIDEFRKVIALNPKHSGAQLKLAELMVASRQKELVEEAATKLHDVLTVSPDDPEVINTLAAAESQLGKTQDAIRRLEESMERFPSHVQSYIVLAHVKLRQKDFAGAEDVLKKAAANAPSSAEAALALGRLYVILQQPEKAEVEVKRALQLSPTSTSVLITLAGLQIAGHRPDEADQTFKQLAALPDGTYRSVHAMFLYQNGKRDSGVAEFEKLAKDHPDDRVVRTLLVRAYLEMNRTREAHQTLTAALKRNAKDIDALFQKSELDLKLGKMGEAEEDLMAVLRFRPDLAGTHFGLASLYKAKGLPKREEEELLQALRLNPKMLLARLSLARSLILANQAKSALEILDQAPALQRSMAAVVIERNWALLALGNIKELRTILDQALRNQRSPDLLLQDALLKMEQRDYLGARIAAEEVLRYSPGEVRAARVVAQSYAAQKEASLALQRLTEIAAGNPKSAPIQHLLGQWNMDAGNLVGARKAFEAAKVADLKFLPADLALAEVDRRENRTEEARQRLIGIATADPRNVPALLTLGVIEGNLGKRPEAIARYRAVLDIDSTNVLALNNLAYALARADPDEALKLASQAVEIAPDSALVLDTVGWVYYQKGIFGSAANYFKAALNKDPTPRTQFHLAMCLVKLGQEDSGQRMLRAALQRDPNLLKTEQGW
jgi:tetratricopeptide (TPR) repeat protein